MPDIIRDVVIIGGGPAGLSAGIYISRERFDVVLLEKTMCGGWLNVIGTIENYPGFPEGVEGAVLSRKFREQAERFGVEIKEFEEGMEIDQGNTFFRIRTAGAHYWTRALVITSGSRLRTLGLPGEAEFLGKGVSYCATCDGPLHRGKSVMVLGGGDTAMQEALLLTKFASKVYLMHRRDRFRGARIMEEQLRNNPKAELLLNALPLSINGDNVVRSVTYRDRRSGEAHTLDVSGVFIFVGTQPNSAFVAHMLETDAVGHIKTDVGMRASRRGVFAAGDVRAGNMRQIALACGEGVLTALHVRDYLNGA